MYELLLQYYTLHSNVSTCACVFIINYVHNSQGLGKLYKSSHNSEIIHESISVYIHIDLIFECLKVEKRKKVELATSKQLILVIRQKMKGG